MNTKIIKLDLNRILYDKIIAKQGDTKSRFLLFQLLDGSIAFNLTNRSVRAYMVKPDGKEIFNDLIINNYSLGYCTLELTNQVLAVPGTVKIELMVTEEDKKLTSSVFELEVIKSINSEKSIVSTNEFTALLNGLSSLSEYDNYKNEIAAARDGEVNLLTKVKKIDEQLDTMKYYATPEMFGGKGDGVTDDSVILQKIIDTTGILIGNPHKTYKANICISKSYTTIKNLNLKGTITFASGLRFVKIEHCNINAEGNEYGIYAESTVTKLYIDDCYITNASECGLYLNNCWDSVLTKLSLSSNKKGFYAYQFNNGTFQGTAYGNDVGIELLGSYSCTVTGTLQENKLNGAIIRSVHASEFRLYLEQNGYQGTDYLTQSQCLIGYNEARCIGTKFVVYAMGGSGSDMESKYGATIMSAINCEINGYFTRHLESGLRVTSTCIDCIANVTDLNHTDYGYDKLLVNRLVSLPGYIKSNTVFEISEKTPILYDILSKNSDVYKSSFEQISSNTAIIRVEDSTGNRPTDVNIHCYYAYNGIKTSI